MGKVYDIREYIGLSHLSTSYIRIVHWYYTRDKLLRHEILVELHYRRVAGEEVPHPSDAPQEPS